MSARPCPQALRVDRGINFEFSHLTVSGDATADRKLKFLKPNLTLDWKPGGGWHTQLSVRRTVAQLDFYDFISVADLSAQPGQRRQCQSAAAAHLGTPCFRRASACSATACSSSTSATTSVSLLQDRILIFDPDHR